jgi:hypothetical protein
MRRPIPTLGILCDALPGSHTRQSISASADARTGDPLALLSTPVERVRGPIMLTSCQRPKTQTLAFLLWNRVFINGGLDLCVYDPAIVQ